MPELGFPHQLAYCLQRASHGIGLTNQFNINDCVEWDVKGRNPRVEHGIIRLIVKPKDNPAREMKKHWGSGKGLRNWSKNEAVKNFYTYVVEQTVGGKSVYRVLTVMKIRKVEL